MHAAPKVASVWLFKPLADSLARLIAHLRTRTEFDAVFAGGVVGKTPHFVLHYVLHKTQGSEAQAAADKSITVGAVLPKRWAKRAVTRNTLKRQIYAVSESLASRLVPGCYIVRLRSEFSRKEFTSATSDALKHAARSELHTLLGTRLVTAVFAVARSLAI